MDYVRDSNGGNIIPLYATADKGDVILYTEFAMKDAFMLEKYNAGNFVAYLKMLSFEDGVITQIVRPGRDLPIEERLPKMKSGKEVKKEYETLFGKLMSAKGPVDNKILVTVSANGKASLTTTEYPPT